MLLFFLKLLLFFSNCFFFSQIASFFFSNYFSFFKLLLFFFLRLLPFFSPFDFKTIRKQKKKKAETFEVIEGSHTLVVKKQFCTMILERQKMNISMKDPMSDLPDPKSNLSGLATSLSKLGVSLHPTNGKNRSINHEDDIFFSKFFYSSIFVFA